MRIVGPSDYSNLYHYLIASGAKCLKENDKWAFIEGDVEGLGEIDLSLPKPGNESVQAEATVASVIDMLGSMYSDTFEECRFRVSGYNRDLFTCKVGEGDYISLKSATDLPSELRRLIGFAYASEKKVAAYHQSPHFLESALIRKYEFGHTIRGSYVVSVRSAQHEKPKAKIQMGLNLEGCSADAVMPVPETPVTRRVSERICRSLDLLSRVAVVDNRSDLTDSYDESLNGNMAHALAGLISSSDTNVNFRTLWAPSLGVPQGAPKEPTWVLRPSMAPILEEAAAKLRDQEPNIVEAVILVRGMETDKAPYLDEAARILHATWHRGDQGPDVKVLVDIESADWYEMAQKAHSNWQAVRIKGTLHHNMGRYRFSDLTEFKV